MVFYKLILTLRINYIVCFLMDLPLELFKLHSTNTWILQAPYHNSCDIQTYLGIPRLILHPSSMQLTLNYILNNKINYYYKTKDETLKTMIIPRMYNEHKTYKIQLLHVRVNMPIIQASMGECQLVLCRSRSGCAPSQHGCVNSW